MSKTIMPPNIDFDVGRKNL